MRLTIAAKGLSQQSIQTSIISSAPRSMAWLSMPSYVCDVKTGIVDQDAGALTCHQLSFQKCVSCQTYPRNAALTDPFCSKSEKWGCGWNCVLTGKHCSPQSNSDRERPTRDQRKSARAVAFSYRLQGDEHNLGIFTTRRIGSLGFLLSFCSGLPF